MATQYNSNPNPTSSTSNYSRSGSVTISTSSAGLRVKKSANKTGSLWFGLGTTPKGFVPVFTGLKVTRNTSSSAIAQWYFSGHDFTFAYNSLETMGAVGTAITYTRQEWPFETNANGSAPGSAIYFEFDESLAYDFTVTGMHVYNKKDSGLPASATLDGGDAGVVFTRADNSLTVTATHDSGNNESLAALDLDYSQGGASIRRSQPSVKLVFPSAGIYPITVTAQPPPIAEDFYYGTPFGAYTKTVNLTVPSGTFTAAYGYQADYLSLDVDASSSIAPSLDPVDTFAWNWGDGSPVTYGQQSSHTYAAAGGYPVTLTTSTTETKRSSTVTKTVTVVAPPNQANYFTAIRDRLKVVFNPSIQDGTSYAWNFGDGSVSTAQSPTHTYGEAGTYAVSLTVNGTLTTTQSVTVLDAYRPLGDLTSALKLEVSVPYPAGTLYNRLPNPSGALGAWGWLTPVSGSYVTASVATDGPEDHGIPGAKLVFHSSGSGEQTFYSDAVRVTAGQYASAQVSVPYVEGYYRMAVEALDSLGAVKSSSSLTGYQAASRTAVVRTAPLLLPTGAVRARVRLTHYGTNTGTVPALGKLVQYRRAMLATASTSAALTTNPYLEGQQWADLIGPTAEITVDRAALDVGTLNALILDSVFDPATSGTIRPGQRVRLRANVEDSAGNSTYQPIYTGMVSTADVAYNPRKAASDPKSTRISLSATDAVTVLASRPQPDGVATLAELPTLLEVAGVPFEVNGSSGQVPAASIVAVNENASVLDQIAITRDTSGSYAHVSRAGVLVAKDPQHMPTAPVGLVDETTFSDVDATFSTAAVINSVTIKWLRYIPESLDGDGKVVKASTEEIVYGPYEDAASIDEWGYQPQTFTMQGVENSAGIAGKANAILAANKTPTRHIESVKLPIRNIEDLAPGKALLDIYDLVQLGYARTDTSEQGRVTGIKHSITPKRWTVELEFARDGATAPPQSVPSPPQASGAVASGGGGGGGTPAPAVPHYYSSRLVSAGVTMSSINSNYTVPWDSTEVAGNVPYDSSAKAFVIPMTGLWDVRTQVGFNSPSADMRVEFGLQLIRGGSTSILKSAIVPLLMTGASYNTVVSPYLVALNEGDKIYITVKGNGGTCKVWFSGSSTAFGFFCAKLVSTEV